MEVEQAGETTSLSFPVDEPPHVGSSLESAVQRRELVEGLSFEVPYFEEMTAYLTQSGQLYNEANCMSFRNVYCFGPTFRAEKSKTRRHLTEFWMVEPEMAYADLNDVEDRGKGDRGPGKVVLLGLGQRRSGKGGHQDEQNALASP